MLVLTGTGKSFSSGYHIGALVERHAGKPGDADEPDSDSSSARSTGSRRCAYRRSPRSTAASTAAATDLALACDFRIGVEGMRLLMPAARLGIVYYPSGIERYVDPARRRARRRSCS